MPLGLMFMLSVGIGFDGLSLQPAMLPETSARSQRETPGALASTPTSDADGDPTNERLPEVRITDPALQRLLQDGYRRSTTLRTLIRDFSRTEWLVFVLRAPCPDGAMVACLLHVVGQFEGRPYLLVRVNPDYRQHRDHVIATLAHELQHALEVATAPGITDSATMEALFRRIGRVRVGSWSSLTYETEAAQRAGEAVLQDLKQPRR